MFIYSNFPASQLCVETEYTPITIRVSEPDGSVVPCPLLSTRRQGNTYLSILDGSALRPWSVYDPALYFLRTDQETERFGFTALSTMQNRAVLLNGCPIFIRGYIRGIVAHDHPNMTGASDYDAARKNISQAKKYGFNLVRFHSTIPSEDFLRAADELGLLVHMEIGFQYDTASDGSRHVSANNAAWTDTILRCRNHPSAAIFCIGNEMHNSGHYPEVMAMYREGRQLAPGKLILDNSGWGEFDRQSADIFCQHIAYYFPYKHHAQMFLTDDPWMLNGSAYDEALDIHTETAGIVINGHRTAVPIRPVLSHEAVHYIDIPDYAALERKFDSFAEKVGADYLREKGIEKPRFMREIAELIQQKGLESYMPDYIQGSRRFKMVGTKVFLERLRLSQLCGFEMLQFSDCLKYENKNGIVDCFDDDKGIDAGWMRQFNSDLVILADLDDEVHYEDTPICMDLYASDFLPKPEVEGTLQVFADADCVYTGHHIFLVGGLQKLLHLELALPKTGNARAVTLRARFSFGSQTISNSWQVWLYPHVRPTFRPEVHLQDAKLAAYLNEGMVRSDTYVTDTLDETVFRELQNHRTVLLFYTYGAEQNRWQFPGAIERFKPCIWDRGSNLGGIVRNPMLQNALATDRFFNLNLQPILENGSKVNLDHFPCTAEMHVLGIDKPARDRLQSLVYGNKKFIDDDTLRRFSHLFSVKVDGGLLIVCTFRVTDTDNPVTSNLLSALLDHTENMDTNCAISAEELREWLNKINKVGMRREDIMNHFWELDNKPVEDSLFWEEYGINLADLR